MATVPESMTLTSWITERAVDWLAERRDPTTPLFLWVSYSKPHPPLDPPEPYYSMYRNCDIEDPPYADWARNDDRPEPVKRHQMAQGTDRMSPELIREARAAYYGLITHIDYNIGRIIGAIQDTGCFFSPNDNTLIAFTADHGELLGDHGMAAKDTFHEGSMHVPFILRLPRTWQDRRVGTEVDSVVAPLDLLSTFVTAAGGAVPEGLPSQDLVALARGQLDTPREYLVCGAGFNQKNPDGAQWVGITDGRWKYAWYTIDGTEQMFDVESDPQELRDLSEEASFDEKKAELKDELIRQLESYASRFVQDGTLVQREFTPPTEAQRRASGFPGFMRDAHKSDALH
jgi:arylsulfatase A-like enzyme